MKMKVERLWTTAFLLINMGMEISMTLFAQIASSHNLYFLSYSDVKNPTSCVCLRRMLQKDSERRT